MAINFNSKYAFELYDPVGNLLADLTGVARSRKVTVSRNEAELIEFNLDLNEFETYSASIFEDPKLLLIPNHSEIRVRRGQSYLAGGQINYVETDISDQSQMINVRADGFLNLLQSRFTADSRVFAATDASTIAWTLINESQALTNGNYGITQGILATIGALDRTYQRTQIKQALQDLSKLESNALDFSFSPTKVFNTFVSMGSRRPEILYEYPVNIKSLKIPNDATNLVNEVIALGSGTGAVSGLVSTQDDLGSQSNYALRQNVLNFSSIITQAELDQNALASISATANPIYIPTLVVDGNNPPLITDYGIGDYIHIRIKSHPFLSDIDTFFRVEKYELAIDDNDNEEITLYLS